MMKYMLQSKNGKVVEMMYKNVCYTDNLFGSRIEMFNKRYLWNVA